MLPSIKSALQRLAGYAESSVIFAMLKNGMLDYLTTQETCSLEDLANKFNCNKDVLGAVLEFAVAAGLLHRNKCGEISVTRQGKECVEARGWYELLVGGYGVTLAEIEELLESGPSSTLRDFEFVGIGSNSISRLDACPMIFELVKRAKPKPGLIVDLGCGSIKGLHYYVTEFPHAKIVGCDAFLSGDASHGSESVVIRKCKAERYEFSGKEEFIVLSFVLHEILGQSGRDTVVRFLNRMRKEAPSAKLVLVEVEPRTDCQESQMCSYSDSGYYNLYYMLQTFTEQKLMSKEFWIRVLSDCNYYVIDSLVVNVEVDTSGRLFALLCAAEKVDSRC